MAVKLKIKKGDKVVVTTDKGKSGEVLAVFPLKTVLGARCEHGEASPKQTAQSEGGIIIAKAKSTFPIWPWLTRKTVSPAALASRLMMTARKRASPNVREKSSMAGRLIRV